MPSGEQHSPSDDSPSVGSVLKAFWTRPRDILIRHWNWKTATISTFIRATIFLFSNLSAGWRAALGTVLVEFGMRPVLAGGLGALTQALRFAQPAWLSSLIVMFLFPAVAHLVEFFVHSLHGTPKLGASIAASVAFSAVSGLLNLYIMRQGVLVVGEADAKSLRTDLRRIPRVLLGFVVAGPAALYRAFRPKLQNPGSPP